MKAQKTITAYCWGSGKIEFGAEPKPGTLPLLKGPSRLVREVVGIYARHGYKRGLLLVPGVPEAKLLGTDPVKSALTMRRLCKAALNRRMGKTTA